jgi:hypothetical protein
MIRITPRNGSVPAIALMTLGLAEPERPKSPMGASAESDIQVKGSELFDVNVDHRCATAKSGA